MKKEKEKMNDEKIKMVRNKGRRMKNEVEGKMKAKQKWEEN